MAKDNAVSRWMHPSKIIHVPVNNTGRHKNIADTPAKRRQHAVQLKDGWWAEQGVKGIPVGEPFAVTEKEAKEYLEKEWEALEKLTEEEEFPTPNKIKISAAQKREAWKARWMPDGKKLVLPEVELIYAYQRGGAINDSIAILIAEGMKPADAVERLSVPVILIHPKTEAERIMLCGLENTGKTAGATLVVQHWPTLFQMAKKYFDASGGVATQSEINKLTCGGAPNNNNGIKIHSLLMLDTKFPELCLYERLCNAGLDDKGNDLGQIYGQSLNRDKVWNFAKRLKAEGEGTIEEYPEGPVTMDEVTEYFEDPKEGNKKAMVPATKAQIANRISVTPNNLEKFVWWVAQTGKMESLVKLSKPELVKACNALAEEFGITKDGQLVTK